MEIFDRESNKFIPSISGLGMHVEVRDPDDKTLMSRVRFHEICLIAVATVIMCLSRSVIVTMCV